MCFWVKMGKISLYFPGYQGNFRPWDRFEVDCIRHDAVFRTCGFPGDGQGAHNFKRPSKLAVSSPSSGATFDAADVAVIDLLVFVVKPRALRHREHDQLIGHPARTRLQGSGRDIDVVADHRGASAVPAGRHRGECPPTH